MTNSEAVEIKVGDTRGVFFLSGSLRESRHSLCTVKMSSPVAFAHLASSALWTLLQFCAKAQGVHRTHPATSVAQ